MPRGADRGELAPGFALQQLLHIAAGDVSLLDSSLVQTLHDGLIEDRVSGNDESAPGRVRVAELEAKARHQKQLAANVEARLPKAEQSLESAEAAGRSPGARDR